MSLQEYCGKLFCLLFPPAAAVTRSERITCAALERTIVTTFVTRDVPCLSPLPYANTLVQTVIHAAKYHNHTRSAYLLGELLAPVLAEEIGERRQLGFFTHPLLIPIPLHSARLLERGFNQSERIAERIRTLLRDEHVTIAPHALVRIKDTSHQAHQHTKLDRAHNMSGAFAVPHQELVYGRDILLVDDVITTGATMRNAAKTLLHAGARDVLCVAAAH